MCTRKPSKKTHAYLQTLQGTEFWRETLSEEKNRLESLPAKNPSSIADGDAERAFSAFAQSMRSLLTNAGSPNDIILIIKI